MMYTMTATAIRMKILRMEIAWKTPTVPKAKSVPIMKLACRRLANKTPTAAVKMCVGKIAAYLVAAAIATAALREMPVLTEIA